MTDKSPPEILFVEDDDFNRRAFGLILRDAGFRTSEAATGREALRLAGQHPDLIILDVSLPDMDGFEVCRRIKAHPATAAIPVLHMSGVFVTTQDRSQALEGGADGYLTKPVEAEELIATVRALLRLHQAEEEARTAALQWQATFDAIHDGLGLIDVAGRVVRCNRALAILLGRSADEVVGHAGRDLLLAAFGTAGTALAQPLDSGGTAREVAVGERWFRVSADRVCDEDGTWSGHVYLLADITRGKELEEQLRQSQKMEAVGRLAGGVAHDFNNLLTAILGNLNLIRQELPEEGPHVELLRVTETATWRAADLTRQLLGFSRRTRLSPRPLDLKFSVEETVALLVRTLGPSIEVRVRSTPGLWPVYADPGQMSQVLLNLALNARDAMPQGGRLLIELEHFELGPDQAPGSQVGDHVRLRVGDTGCGIAQDILPRVFDPFFTTKDIGKGSGLGLAVVFGIVQAHQGWVECRSKVGEGTTFDIYLPRYREPVSAE